MSDTLPDFPVDDFTLTGLEHALGYYLVHDPDADPDEPFPFKGDGADYSLHEFLDFMAGATDDEGELLPESEWINQIPTYMFAKPRYTYRDVIKSLIDEIRRLRGDIDGHHE